MTLDQVETLASWAQTQSQGLAEQMTLGRVVILVAWGPKPVEVSEVGQFCALPAGITVSVAYHAFASEAMAKFSATGAAVGATATA